MTTSIKVSLRIIALFSAAILISKIPDLYHNLFGDWYCEGRKYVYSTDIVRSHYIGCDMLNEHNPKWHWGYQHWLFFLMGVSLSIVQIVDIISIITKRVISNGK